MKALTFQGKYQIGFDTIPDPGILAPEDAIVKVTCTAICGSDLHIYRAHEQGLDEGTVMGHEFAGEIVETGHGVKHLRKGDQVVSPFTTSCGQCFYCLRGLTCRCEKGQLFGWVEGDHGLHGAQAEYVRVPMADSTLVRIPEGISADIALFTGDILSTGYYCADRVDIRPEGTYVVVGCGPVGLMAIQAAFQLGATQVFAIDGIPERLEIARKLGAQILNFQSQDMIEIVKSKTGGRGADGVMEAVGSPAAGRLAFDLIRPGGTISTVGVHTGKEFFFNPVEAYDKNITYRIGRSPARHYMEPLLEMIREKQFSFEGLVTHRLSLSEGAKGYEIFEQKQEGCIKVVLYPEL